MTFKNLAQRLRLVVKRVNIDVNEAGLCTGLLRTKEKYSNLVVNT
jgi:hypothetical protein